MFFKKKINLAMIDPSSKIALKMSCLQSANGDVSKAQELYNYLVDGIDSMPDFPIAKPSTMQQIQQTANGVFTWLKENQQDILNIVGIVKQLGGGNVAQAAAQAAEAIPPLTPIE
jgi:hypothetical protein